VATRRNHRNCDDHGDETADTSARSSGNAETSPLKCVELNDSAASDSGCTAREEVDDEEEEVDGEGKGASRESID